MLYLACQFTIPGLPTLYYGDEIGMTGAGDPDNRRMMRFSEELSPAENGMFEEVKKLVQLRRRHPALRYGDFQSLYADESCYAYLRSDFNERILTVLNKSSQPQTLQVPLPAFYEIQKATHLTNEEEFSVSDNSLKLNIPPIGWAFYRLE